MYLPRVFEGRSDEVARALMQARPLATLVGVHPGGAVEIAHAPLLLDDGPTVRLAGHLARANPLARLVAARAPVTAVFHGPEAYVSPTWYEGPSEQVPTWNFAVVHVEGELTPLDDDALADQLARMARAFEAREPAPWSVDLLDPAFFADLRQAIVGFAITARTVTTKLKLSQNRTPTDRARVAVALGRSDEPRDREVARLMERLEEP